MKRGTWIFKIYMYIYIFMCVSVEVVWVGKKVGVA